MIVANGKRIPSLLFLLAGLTAYVFTKPKPRPPSEPTPAPSEPAATYYKGVATFNNYHVLTPCTSCSCTVLLNGSTDSTQHQLRIQPNRYAIPYTSFRHSPSLALSIFLKTKSHLTISRPYHLSRGSR